MLEFLKSVELGGVMVELPHKTLLKLADKSVMVTAQTASTLPSSTNWLHFLSLGIWDEHTVAELVEGPSCDRDFQLKSLE